MKDINSNNFDFLRIVFALTVAIAHLIELSGVELFQPYSKYFNTRLAIDGFFIISGFLIAKSYEKSTSFKDYATRRIRRIIPAYFLVILICAIGLYVISKSSFQNYFGNSQFWKYLVCNLLFQNYLEPCLPGVFQENNSICAVNGALWTIKIEEAFYLTVPLLYWIVKKKWLRANVLCIIIFFLSILYFNYFISIDKYRIAKQLPGAMAFFSVGILLYRNFDFFFKNKDYIIIPCIILFYLEQYIYKTHFLKPASFGFIVFYAAYNFRFLKNFGKYGDFTYGIYILHFPIIQLFTYCRLYQKFNPFLTGSITILLVCILAILSWYYVELPNLPKSRQMRQKLLRG